MAVDDGGGMTTVAGGAMPDPTPAAVTGRKMSPEHLAKMQAGKAAYLERVKSGEIVVPDKRIRNPKKPKRAAHSRRTSAASEPQESRPGGTEVRARDTGPAPRQPPFSFPRPDRLPDVSDALPRLVPLAEVKAALDQFWPLILDRFPMAQQAMVRGHLAMATRGERHRLFVSRRGLALFEQRQTPWEPLPIVATVFAVGADRDVLVAAGMNWARQIRAIAFDPDGGAPARVNLRAEQAA